MSTRIQGTGRSNTVKRTRKAPNTRRPEPAVEAHLPSPSDAAPSDNESESEGPSEPPCLRKSTRLASRGARVRFTEGKPSNTVAQNDRRRAAQGKSFHPSKLSYLPKCLEALIEAASGMEPGSLERAEHPTEQLKVAKQELAEAHQEIEILKYALQVEGRMRGRVESTLTEHRARMRCARVRIDKVLALLHD